MGATIGEEKPLSCPLKVQLFQDRILTDAEQLALATGAAAYRWEDLTKALCLGSPRPKPITA